MSHTNKSEPDSRPMDENVFENPFQLGEWLVLPRRNCIKGDDSEARVEPKVMQALVFLASHHNEVVSREELHRAIWGDTIVNDETLTRIISQLRVALQDDRRAIRFIETIYKRGYRLIAPLALVEYPQADMLNGTEQIPEPEAGQAGAAGAGRGRLFRFGIPSMVVAACLTTWLAIWGFQRNAAPAVMTPWQPVPVTTFVDDELFPAISPDGRRVAFSWNGGSGDRNQIWIKDLDSGDFIQVTNTDRNTAQSTWSPCGTKLVYRRHWSDCSGELVLCHLDSDEPERVIFRANHTVMGLDWSPDGGRIALSTLSAEHPFPLLYLLDMETGETSLFLEPQGPWCQDVLPAFSPDGKWLAFARRDRSGAESVFMASLGDGEVRRMTPPYLFIQGIDWLSDSSEILFCATLQFDPTLLRVALEDGRVIESPVRVPLIGLPSLSHQGNRMVFEEYNYDQDIWKYDIQTEASPASLAPLIQSTEHEAGAVLSHDGKQLAYLSIRTGIPQVWISANDGGHQRQLTDFETGTLHHVRWSPNDQHVCVVHQEESGNSVCVVDTKSGAWRHIGDSNRNEMFRQWSRNGRWIYYMTDRGGDLQLWRMLANGSGAEKILEDNPSFFGETVDGQGLVFAKNGSDAIWTHSLVDGSQRLLVDEATAAGWSSREMTSSGLQYVKRARWVCSVGYFDLETGHAEILAELPFEYILGLQLSADRSCIIFDMTEQYNANITMVENFQ